jgi:hypothetical protein
MNLAYSSEPWAELFVGVAGASAALTGLLFVSLSINLDRILADPWLPRRAGLTLMLLFEVLVIAIVGLVPGQSGTALGAELLVVGCLWWLFATGVFTVRRPPVEQGVPIVVNMVAAQLATLPVIVAGAVGCCGSFLLSCCFWASGSCTRGSSSSRSSGSSPATGAGRW